MNLEKYKGNEIELVREQTKNVRTVYEVVRLPGHLIAENYVDQLINMIIELNQFANVSRKMTESQITETVNMLFQEYPRMSLQEYAIFFRKIKAGYYGQLYESLDGIKIMAFMNEYYKEVVKATHEYAEEAHRERKENWGSRDLNKYNNF